MARSYARCSSVLFGARMPSPPAISLAATAVCFAGLTRGGPGDRLPDTLDGTASAYGGVSLVAVQGAPVCGEIGVGGGASGPSAEGVSGVEVSASSFSVSEPDEASSSSHESAIGTASFFGFVEPFLVIGRGTSFAGFLFVMLRSWRQDSNWDSSSSVAVSDHEPG